MKCLRVLAWLLVLIAVTLSACAHAAPTFQYQSDSTLRNLAEQVMPSFPAVQFAVLSDSHLYDPSLGTTGSAFEASLNSDRKLLREGPEILQAAITDIIQAGPSFVLITGDLTKDGEASSHALMVSYLQQLKAAGIQVYVVPGNHDILNGSAFRFTGDEAIRVPNVTPEEFARLYADFGYDQAVLRDSNSLSYVVEPAPGLWLVALDSCVYGAYQEDWVSGRFSPATLAWIESTLAEALRQNKAVIVVMHHGILQHFSTEARDLPDYLVADYKAVARMFAVYHVRMVVTGHCHAQDIVVERWAQNQYLYDVETGALVSYPNRFRLVEITAEQTVTIRSQQVTSIPSHPVDFVEYARSTLLEGVGQIGVGVLRGYGVALADAELLAPQAAAAFMAHYQGDETLPVGQSIVTTSGLSLKAWAIIMYRRSSLASLWQDLPPADNSLNFSLKTGDFQ